MASEVKNLRKAKITDIRSIAVVGVLGALAAIVMMLEIPLPFLPPFYKLDFSEVPVLLGGFALGPVSAALIEAIKVILHMILGGGTQTVGIGEFANFLFGCSLVVPASIIYRIHKNRKTALIGMGVGTIIMIIVGALINAFVLLPVYAIAFHMPMAMLIQLGTNVNSSITDLTSFVMLATTPLNLIKAVLVSIITFLLYKRVSPILHGHVK